jgi:ribosomal protein S12 methylthiotransferase accessory factor
MFESLARHYKERAPAETVATIRSILAEIDLWPEPTELASPYPGLHSVRLSLPPSQGGYGAYGKGPSLGYCLASAHAEFIERMQNSNFHGLGRTMLAPLRERHGFYYAPDEQYLTDEQLLGLPGDVIADLVRYSDGTWASFIGPYGDRAKAGGAPGVVAVPFYDTGRRNVVSLPLNLVLRATGTNGMAAGNTLAEAIFQACCEILERWAAAEVFYRRLTPPSVPRSYLQQFPQEYGIIELIEGTGKHRVTVKDFSCGLRIPTLGLIIENVPANTYRLNVGSETCFQVALCRCLTEMYQGVTDAGEFDRWMLPIPRQDPPCFRDGSMASRYQRLSDFVAFICDGTGPYPSTLFGQEPSYPLASEFWSPKASYEEEVQRMVAFFHRAGHNMYIRDVSFLGFPSVYVCVPGVSTQLLADPPTSRTSVLPLSIALNDIEARALKLKQCSDEDLAAIANVLERLPAGQGFANTFGILLKPFSPWRQVNVAFILALIRCRLGQYDRARESIQWFLGTRAEKYRYRYYQLVSRYLARRAEGLTHAEAAQQLAEDPQWGEVGRQMAEEMADPQAVFRFTKLPNCPDCGECELEPDCLTTGTLATVDKVYPAMRRNGIRQAALAWVNS